MTKLRCMLCCLMICTITIDARTVNDIYKRISAQVSLKVPGNQSRNYSLAFQGAVDDKGIYLLESEEKIPLIITERIERDNVKCVMVVSITALEDVYFNYQQQLKTGFRHNDCMFYLPGFWYSRNLRSPKGAPSFHISESWLVREDRLSSPLTGIFNQKDGRYMTVARKDDFQWDALATHQTGEIILSGKTSLGFTGFESHDGTSTLSFGFPYREAPKTYIRKLTLAPEVTSFQYLKKGETVLLTWEFIEGQATDYSDFICHTWEYCYDTYRPQPVKIPFSPEEIKGVLSNYFVESFVGDKALAYYSSPEMKVAACANMNVAEIGFVGRVLLNAFNAWEFGNENGRDDLAASSKKIFDSYLENGFTETGYLREWVNLENDSDVKEERPVHSIRRQSEGIYAMFHYLNYEQKYKRHHPDWEQRLKKMLDMFLQLQNPDGSFPRKFHDDFTVVDGSGGSTPSATLPLVMGYKYFKDKRYLSAARRTAEYLEKELISKADYFSSTLDANCADKEASLYTATATYYLSLITNGTEHNHYASLTRKAAYFALSWYYVWDVPFAPGQMLGDIGLKTRGWGNVSVENNHIDVFIFEFADVLRWLSKEYNEPRFSDFAEVISTSMCQLLPYKGHMCGVIKVGYYPEVIQHTNWDYGRNGKGYYNDMFAPGWTVASLWELLTPGRTENILLK